jgi:hypothetical protein
VREQCSLLEYKADRAPLGRFVRIRSRNRSRIDLDLALRYG